MCLYSLIKIKVQMPPHPTPELFPCFSEAVVQTWASAQEITNVCVVH